VRSPARPAGSAGFVPPLVMGAVYGSQHSYAIGLMLLSDVALAAAVCTGFKMAGRPCRKGPTALSRGPAAEQPGGR
jgi:hypothetical protein